MDDRIVKEAFCFTFQFLGDLDDEQSGKQQVQRLLLSRDLSKLMEVYGDSKCRIWR